jgi:glycosylphosphatidylinositol transamidase (GPIT) subunit GPI8
MGKLNQRWKVKFKDLLCKLNVDAIKSWIQMNITDQKMNPTTIKTFFNAAQELIDANAFTKDPQKIEFLHSAISTYETTVIESKDQVEPSVPVGLTQSTESSA